MRQGRNIIRLDQGYAYFTITTKGGHRLRRQERKGDHEILAGSTSGEIARFESRYGKRGLLGRDRYYRGEFNPKENKGRGNACPYNPSLKERKRYPYPCGGGHRINKKLGNGRGFDEGIE